MMEPRGRKPKSEGRVKEGGADASPEASARHQGAAVQDENFRLNGEWFCAINNVCGR